MFFWRSGIPDIVVDILFRGVSIFLRQLAHSKVSYSLSTTDDLKFGQE